MRFGKGFVKGRVRISFHEREFDAFVWGYLLIHFTSGTDPMPTFQRESQDKLDLECPYCGKVLPRGFPKERARAKALLDALVWVGLFLCLFGIIVVSEAGSSVIVDFESGLNLGTILIAVGTAVFAVCKFVRLYV